MLESIQKCCVCEKYFDEKVLTAVKVPDQGGGYIQKPICKSCLWDIEDRSNNPGAAKDRKHLLTEKQG
jgi:hypothetical protein